jgi:hypothetical protein
MLTKIECPAERHNVVLPSSRSPKQHAVVNVAYGNARAVLSVTYGDDHITARLMPDQARQLSEALLAAAAQYSLEHPEPPKDDETEAA